MRSIGKSDFQNLNPDFSIEHTLIVWQTTSKNSTKVQIRALFSGVVVPGSGRRYVHIPTELIVVFRGVGAVRRRRNWSLEVALNITFCNKR